MEPTIWRQPGDSGNLLLMARQGKGPKRCDTLPAGAQPFYERHQQR